MKENKLMKCFIIIIICFVVDSTISFFLPYNYTKSAMTIVHYIGMMMFTLLIKSLESVEKYFYASLCGVYYSVVYSNSIAIYILIYCLIAFVRTHLIKIESFSMLESSVFSIMTIFACEIIVYWLMWITNMTSYPVQSFMVMRILPTILVNFGLSFIVWLVYNNIELEVKA